MNRKMTAALLAALIMTASLASCGNVGGSDDTSSAAETTAAEEIAAPEETTPEEEVYEPEETTTEEEEPAESEPDDSSAAEKDDSEPEVKEPVISEHEVWISQIADHTFEDGHTFKELCDLGMANVYQEGKAYAIVSMEGGAGAGSVYYKVYNSTDNGQSWLECENYREANGGNSHFALDDGGIMLFSNHSARAVNYPIVTYLYFDGIGIKAFDLEEVLAQTALSDGTLLKDVEDINYEAEYLGGYKFHLLLTDPFTYEDVFDDDIDLSSAVDNTLSNMF